MKIRFIIPVVLFFLSISTGCKQRNISESCLDMKQLSKELERRPEIVSTPINSENKSRNTLSSFSKKEETNIVFKEAKQEKILYLKGKSIPLKVRQNPKTKFQKTAQHKDLKLNDFDKNNKFWRIGKIIFKVGLTVMGLLGAISIGVSSNSGFLFSLFGGLLIGLFIVALSIPFFILGFISEIMKNKRSRTLENTNEI
jgi:hypothetical protein